MTTGPGRPDARDMERLVQHARQVGDRAHQSSCAWCMPGDADGVAFLEGVSADQVRRHLAGDADQRDGVEQRVGQSP